MSGLEDHLRIVLREASATVARMEAEHATTAAAAHYHVCQVARRFLLAAPAFPPRPSRPLGGGWAGRGAHKAVTPGARGSTPRALLARGVLPCAEGVRGGW